jgi:hypothetical protein
MAEGRFLSGVRGGLVVLGIGLAVVAVVLIGPGRKGAQGSGPAGSSFATGDRGAKAAYLLLGRLGHQVERRTRPLGDLRATRLAFFLSPSDRLDEIDTVALTKWIEGGGTLVFGADSFNGSDGIARRALRLMPSRVAPTSGTRATLDKQWRPAQTLSVRTIVSAADVVDTDDEDETQDDEEGSAPTAIAHAGDQAVALRFGRGEGAIYVIDARVFSNEGLKAADNAVFLAVLAAKHAGGAPIAFDEYVHGFGNIPSLITMIAWPLKIAFGVAVLALLLYALAIGRRLGRPSPEPGPPRRASIEQIEALAAYFAAGNDRQTALVALAAFAEKPVPMPPPRDDRTLLLAAQSLVGHPAARTTTKGAEWPSTGSTPPPRK